MFVCESWLPRLADLEPVLRTLPKTKDGGTAVIVLFGLCRSSGVSIYSSLDMV